MADVRISAVRERTRITEEGEFERYNEVIYFVNDAKHKLTMPTEGFTAKKAEEAVRKAAAEFVALTDKKVEIGP